MKKMDKEFSSRGFYFKQIHRESDFAIYERWHENSDKKHYEVVIIQSHNGYSIGDQSYPPSEFYPSSNSWGTDGFTCVSKEAAYKRLDEMIEYHKIKEEEKKKKDKNK
jgi:hypothetical protein